MSFFKKMAKNALEILDKNPIGIEKITSGQQNAPGIHLAVIPYHLGLLPF